MIHSEFHYRWKWLFKSNPEALWPFVSDTNRYNRDAGAPPLEPMKNDSDGRGNRRRRLRLSWLGIPLEYEEEPFEWVRPHRFGVYRRFSKGPVAYMRIAVELSQSDAGGTQMIFQLSSKPRSFLAYIAIPVQLGILGRRGLHAAFGAYDDLVSRGLTPIELKDRGRLSPGGEKRLRNLREKLSDQGAAPKLLPRLIDTVKDADDLSLMRMRPYELADSWGASRREVLELCLLATRAGLLDFRWDLLCPLCRGAQESSPGLKDVHTNVHCESCNIDFTVNFERLVEVTFKPNPAVRSVKAFEFCVGGPQVTPHIVVQQLLPHGERRSLTPVLETGRYRLRTMKLPGGQLLTVADGGHAAATLRADGTGWPSNEIELSHRPNLLFENATNAEQLFVLERMAWTDRAATAAEVIALQRFRDLFSSEVLRPGEQISVGSLTILFTDLRNSTRLYREVGDAPAFGYVVNHFDIMRDAISAKDGSLIKTMGDAVMAVFRRPASALRAIVAVQERLSASENSPRLMLKAGIHYGPCIAVTLNDRLDYFGSTVNVAARLEGLSQGGDVIISSTVGNDPEVMDFLHELKDNFTVEPVEAMLKGFEKERFDLLRIVPKNSN